MKNTAVVVTSISAPNLALKEIASGAQSAGSRFIVIGDGKSPGTFELEGTEFYSVKAQVESGLEFARLCPTAKYSRKNIGYLLAIRSGAECIVETDDDNIPRKEFWSPRCRSVTGRLAPSEGWVNAYRFFSKTNIYPRGFPLEELAREREKALGATGVVTTTCPIQQGLADANPDVDAIYRMLLPLPIDFDQDEPLVLPAGAWCPFNSQNTTFFPEVYPLLYLPTYCSFRMTDIWRSFVAQRVLWTCGWTVSFHSATVYQERNDHSLLKDFADEVPGYLNNARIAKELSALDLLQGSDHIAENLLRCYEALIALGLVGIEERSLLQAWLRDLPRSRSVNPTLTS